MSLLAQRLAYAWVVLIGLTLLAAMVWSFTAKKWVVFTPLAALLLIVLLGFLPKRPRQITALALADELEAHLQSGEWNEYWEDVVRTPIKDERLDQLRLRLREFDDLDTPALTDELRRIIDGLRRGEIPTVRNG